MKHFLNLCTEHVGTKAQQIQHNLEDVLQLSLSLYPQSVPTLTQPLLSQPLSVSAKETHTWEGQGGWKDWKQASLEMAKQPAAFRSTVQVARVCCALSP